MTLKKDAMIAVSLAGIVLILAIGATKARENSSHAQPTSVPQVDQNTELLKTYIQFMSSRVQAPNEESELRYATAREVARRLYEGGRLGAPIDLMRASAIFASSRSHFR